MNHLNETENEGNGKVIHMSRSNSGGAAVFADDKPVWFVKARNIIYYLLGFIEVILGLRFLFMLLGANPRSGFTAFLYMITGVFISPFSGIFNPLTTSGLVSRSVLDPATIIAMLIYALAAWGIVKLLWIKASKEGY